MRYFKFQQYLNVPLRVFNIELKIYDKKNVNKLIFIFCEIEMCAKEYYRKVFETYRYQETKLNKSLKKGSLVVIEQLFSYALPLPRMFFHYFEIDEIRSRDLRYSFIGNGNY